MRHKLLIILLCMTALIASACSTPATETPAPLEPQTIRIATLPTLSHAPLHIADRAGHFAEQGLEVEYVEFERSTEAIPVLAQGQLDVVAGALSAGLLNVVAEGAEIKLVADNGYVAPDGCYYWLVASQEIADGGGLSNPDLAGKNVSVAEGLFFHYWVDKTFEEAGVDLSTMELVRLPIPTIAETLSGGDLAFAVADEPIKTRIVQSGSGVGVANAADNIPEFQVGFIMFGPSILEDNPDLGQRFMMAYMQAVRQFNEGKTDENVALLHDALGLEEDLLREVCWPTYRDDLSLNGDSIEAFQTWAIEGGYLESPVVIDDLIDPQFAEHALEELGE